MKQKIIVSLLLVLLLAISASAVSASDDLDDAITETSDSISDLELSDEDANAACEDESGENLVADNAKTDSDKLGDGGVSSGGNNITIKNANQLSLYLEDRGSTHYNNGDVFLLDNTSFDIQNTININKSFTIDGRSGARISGNVDTFFTVKSPANKGPSSVTIRNVIFIPTKQDQTILLAKGVTQGINQVINIAGVTLENITIWEMAGINPTITLLNIESDQNKTETSNAINITNNQLNGAKALKINGYQMTHDGLNGEEIYLPANEIIFQKKTKVTATYYLQYAVDESAGDSPFDFIVWLSDEDGYAVVGRTITFALNSTRYTAKTNDNGEAHLKLSISKAGTYDIYSIFQEDDEQYAKSDMVASTIQILKKESALLLKNVSYKSTAKTKKLTATFKVPIYEFVFDGYSINQKLKGYQLIKNKKVTFTVNGKTYSAKTNSKGIATVKITLNKKGTYTYKAKFAGDNTYNAVTKSAKLTIKPVATSLTVKKYTFKRKAKTKKIKATLKVGSKVLKSKKVTFTVNGKKYSAKTNSKGIATVKIKLTKKGTFKYTAKFAGDNMYKATSKSNKVVLK